VPDYRVGGDNKLIGDLLVALALSDEPKYFDFAGREAIQASAKGVDGPGWG
jgi:hypothetical protein